MKILKILLITFIVSVSLFACSRGDTQVSEHFEAGNAELTNYNYSKALEQFKLAINDTPTHIESYVNAADILILKGQYDAALEILNTGLENNGNISILNQRAGLIQHRLGNYDQALEYYDQAIKSDKANNEAIIGKARILALQENQTEVKKTLNEISDDNINQDILFLRGLVDRNEEIGIKNLEAAQKGGNAAISLAAERILKYTENIQKNPDKELINLANMAFALIDAGYFEFAMPFTTEIIAMNDYFATGYLYRGLILLETNSYEDALSNITQAIRIDPDESTAYLLAAETNFRLGKNKAALDNIKVLASDLKKEANSDLLKETLDLLLSYEEPGSALAYATAYKDSAKTIPLEIQIAYLKALVINEEYATAIATGTSALESESKMTAQMQAEVYAFTGYAKFESGDKAEGLSYIKKSQTLNPVYALSFLYEGKALLAQGDVNAAKEKLERAAELDFKDKTDAKDLLKTI